MDSEKKNQDENESQSQSPENLQPGAGTSDTDSQKLRQGLERGPAGPGGQPNRLQISFEEFDKRLKDFRLKLTVPGRLLFDTVNKINPDALIPIQKLPEDVKISMKALQPAAKRFHGASLL